MSAISIVVARMDIHKLCQDEKQISPTQFYNSAITVISILIAGELLLGCACLLLLRRSSSVSGAEGGASRQLAEINWLGKIKAICMHGIISSKGFFSAEQFRQVFLIVLAPARFDTLAFFRILNSLCMPYHLPYHLPQNFLQKFFLCFGVDVLRGGAQKRFYMEDDELDACFREKSR
jgi:hypothetical protein